MEQQSRVPDIADEIKIGKLFMIDLAGSERASQTQVRIYDFDGLYRG